MAIPSVYQLYLFPIGKRCSRCGDMLPFSAFSRLKRSGDGYNYWCRKCFSSHRTALAHLPDASCDKRCAQCGDSKLASEFYRDKRASDGLKSTCKACFLEKSKTSYAADIERKRAQQRITAKAFRERNREKLRSKGRLYHLKHRIKKLRYYHEHRDHFRSLRRRWAANHPGAASRAEHKRRALKLQNGGTYTDAEWDALCEHYDHRCLACGAQGPLTVDHVIPLTKGGGNDIGNLQPLCASCNSSKNARIIDYRRRFGAAL